MTAMAISEETMNTSASLALIVMTLVTMPFPLVMFWRRRNIQPIRSREPIIAFIGGVTTMCFVLCQAVLSSPAAADTIPFIVGRFIYLTLVFAAIELYLARCWIMYFVSKIANENYSDSTGLYEAATTTNSTPPRKPSLDPSYQLSPPSSSIVENAASSQHALLPPPLPLADGQEQTAQSSSIIDHQTIMIEEQEEESSLNRRHANPGFDVHLNCWYRCNRILISHAFLSKLLFLTLPIFLFPSVFLVMFAEDDFHIWISYSDGMKHEVGKRLALIDSGIFLCLMLVFVPLALKLGFCQRDSFGIKAEFVTLAKISIFANLLYIVVPLVQSSDSDFQIVPILRNLHGQSIFWVSIGVPLVNTFVHLKGLAGVSTSNVRLERFLSNRRCFLAFQDFLKSEYALESLMFWYAERSFSTRYSGMGAREPSLDMWNDAVDIYRQFLAPFAMMEINVDSEILFFFRKVVFKSIDVGPPSPVASCLMWPLARTGLDDACSKAKELVGSRTGTSRSRVNGEFLGPAMFARARREIVELMAKDSLMRFVQKPQYSEIWDDFMEMEREEEVLANKMTRRRIKHKHKERRGRMNGGKNKKKHAERVNEDHHRHDHDEDEVEDEDEDSESEDDGADQLDDDHQRYHWSPPIQQG